jgi:hypothetical protein
MNLFLMITWCVLLVVSYLLSVKVLEKSGKM